MSNIEVLPESKFKQNSNSLWPNKYLIEFEPHNPLQNSLLAALPNNELNKLIPYLELVEMPLGKVLSESGERLQYAYFPTTCILSLHYVLAEGTSSEITAVGNEGMLGVSLYMGGETTPSRATVRSAGYGYRLKAQLLKIEFSLGGPFMHLLLRYSQALMTQVTQTAICNKHHTIEQQLCRCLLVSLDRLQGDSLAMTQELISSILGVRRESITAVAGKLQRVGLIRYYRGHIEVLDRLRLEKFACECYLVVKQECDRLLTNLPKKLYI